MSANLHHTGLTVSSIERALTFWRDALGMEVVLDQEIRGDYLAAIVGEPGARARAVQLRFARADQRLELLEYSGPPGTRHRLRPPDVGFCHVAVVSDELDALLGRLVQAGGEPYGVPVTVDQGANAGARAVYVRDMDGHTLELVQPAPRAASDQ